MKQQIEEVIRTVPLESLNRYVQNYFSDCYIPEIQNFLCISKITNNDISAKAFLLDPTEEISNNEIKIFQKQQIYYIQSGIIELHKKVIKGDNNHSSKIKWVRQIELKDGNFFTLINYKNYGSLEPEVYQIVAKTKAHISYIPINAKFNYHWFREQSLKNQLLSKLFYFNDLGQEAERKKLKFKKLAELFHHEQFHRDSKLISENQSNKKLFVIAKGQARWVKTFKMQTKDGRIIRSVDVVYTKQGSVIGSQLMINSSKAVKAIVNQHNQIQMTEHKKQKKHKQKKHQDEQVEEDINKIERQQKKKNENYYQLHQLVQNLSNFTVFAESGNLEVYFIQIQVLISVITERWRSNLFKFLQQNYITCLRLTHEKMVMQYESQQRKLSHKHQKIQLVAAQAITKQEAHSLSPQKRQESIEIKKSEILPYSSTGFIHLKDKVVSQSKKDQIQKKLDLLDNQQKPRSDYKKKIQMILEAKLNAIQQSPELQKSIQRQNLINNLEEIFMKKQKNRSEDIQKQAQLLKRKQVLLHKRSGGKIVLNLGDIVVSQAIQKRITFSHAQYASAPTNYLRGLDINDYAIKIKQQYSNKIHETNKIKQQFMKIKSQCPSCNCYDNFQTFHTHSSQKNIFSKTTRTTFSPWVTHGRITKTPDGQDKQEPLESVYRDVKFLREKSKEKYNRNLHLLKIRRNHDKLQRRRSAPFI